MSEHRAQIRWKRATSDFDLKTYNREHSWTFPKGGLVVAASAAPEYRGKPEGVDPEEALVASLSSCHMLTFLALASRRNIVVDSYDDEAVGVLEKNAEGRMAITRVNLRPRITFAGPAPDAATLQQLHHQAHADCFIANSVKTLVSVNA